MSTCQFLNAGQDSGDSRCWNQVDGSPFGFRNLSCFVLPERFPAESHKTRTDVAISEPRGLSEALKEVPDRPLWLDCGVLLAYVQVRIFGRLIARPAPESTATYVTATPLRLALNSP
jgi:hypothetical protein